MIIQLSSLLIAQTLKPAIHRRCSHGSVRTVSMRLEPSPRVKRVKSPRSAESRGFSPCTPVSSHMQGKLTGWVRSVKRAHSNWHMLLW
jgi:hypothetical protein